MRNQKAQIGLGELSTIGVIFVVLAVVLAVGAYILSQIDSLVGSAVDSVPANPLNYNQWLLILVVTIVAGIVICILVSVFQRGRSDRGAV